MESLVKYKMTICLYNKLKNTGDMTGIVHNFCKYITFDLIWPLFHTFLMTCSRVFLQYQEDSFKDIRM